MTPIKFGTDGWRAVTGEDFIPSNITKVIQAFCDWRKKVDPKHTQVIVGFDRRNQSVESSQLVIQVLLANGFSAKLSKAYCPTPCVSWAVKVSEAFAGIMVTASHNPWHWNGIKFKEEYGGSASPEYTSEIEKQLSENEKAGRSPLMLNSFDEAKRHANFSTFDPYKDYLGHLAKLIDIDLIKKSGFKILYDPMHGAGVNYLKNLLGDCVTELHTDTPPVKGGINPEPIDKNLTELLQIIKQGGYHAGLTTDGDADRIGAVDEHGNFVNSHQIFALLLTHYIEDKKLKGTIVKSLSTSLMIDILCKKFGLKLIETPIGFKHICKKLVEHNALMGGEESGGLSFEPHVHERDGILNGLFLLEMMAERKKTLAGLVKQLEENVGTFHFNRIDMHLEVEKIKKLTQKLSNEKIESLAGMNIASLNATDGFKFVFSDKSWLLLRASGTEPLLRIYAEAGSTELVKKLLAEGEKLAKSV